MNENLQQTLFYILLVACWLAMSIFLINESGKNDIWSIIKYASLSVVLALMLTPVIFIIMIYFESLFTDTLSTILKTMLTLLIFFAVALLAPKSCSNHSDDFQCQGRYCE